MAGLRHFWKSIPNRILGKLGFRVVRTSQLEQARRLGLEAALGRLLREPRAINSVIDIGASDGRWSRIVQAFLPSAAFMLVEANPCHEDKLAAYKSANPNVDYVMAAAGDTVGSINFDASAAFGGLATHKTLEEFADYNLQLQTPIREEQFLTVPVTTVDRLVAEKGLKPPFFLKMDTHGFEVPILNGASETLKHSGLVEIECYNFRVTKDSLRFHEMIGHMESQGFSVIDLCDPDHRALDQALWQLDLFFVPSTSREFQSHVYG